MAQAPCLYQETRLNLEPASPGSVVDIQIPSQTSFSSRLSPKRRRIDQAPRTYDEETFSRYELASESAIHFRRKPDRGKKERSPRAVLWRILDERKLLELQAVDLYQEKPDKDEPLLTLRFSPPDPIVPGGVAFAERELQSGTDALVVFVLTRSGELHTLTLRREHFAKREYSQESANGTLSWLTSSTVSSFTWRKPFRMIAKSCNELWISCVDGSLVKLESKDGSVWRDTAHSEGGWKDSMRGFWKSSKTARFNDMDLAAGTCTSLALSPTGKHMLATGLDHTLRLWNIEKGTLVERLDLAGDTERDLQKPPDSLLQPSYAQRVQTIPGKQESEFYVATFSPKIRQFKIWLVTEDDEGHLNLSDARPDVEFSPPSELDDGAVWNLESFHIQLPKPRSHEWRLWMMLRSGSRSQTFTTSFNLDDHADNLERAWRDHWACTDAGFISARALDVSMHNPTNSEAAMLGQDGSSAAEKWLSYLFHPSRFTSATLETALFIYQRSLGSTGRANEKTLGRSRDQSLESRISEVVGSSVRLGPMDQDSKSFARYERAIASQWQIFYGVVKDLHFRREETLSMVVDPEEHLPWLVSADFISPVRACGQTEILWHNQDKVPDRSRLTADLALLRSLEDAASLDLSRLFYGLEVFRNCLSGQFLHSFHAAVYADSLLNSRSDGMTRLMDVHKLTSFENQVSDDDYDKFTDALAPWGALPELDTQTIRDAVELLTAAQKGRHHIKHAQTLGRYGARTLLRGSQDTLELCHTILIDLLLLVVFVGGELEEGDLSQEFDAGDSFEILTARFKQIQLLSWLSSTPVQQEKSKPAKVSKNKPEMMFTGQATKPAQPSSSNMTLLGDLFMSEWSELRFPSEPQQSLITYWIEAWTFALPLEPGPFQYEQSTGRILGSLITSGDYNRALEFLPFMTEKPWASYLIGRLYLLTSHSDQAVIYFENAAEGGGVAENVNFDLNQIPGILLDDEDRELVCSGYGRYCLHVSILFERSKAGGYAVDFARKGLTDKGLDDKTQTALYTHLFSSAIKISQFTLAFDTIPHHPEAARSTALQTYITTLHQTNNIPTLLRTPFSAHNLSTLADSIISSLPQYPSKPHSSSLTAQNRSSSSSSTQTTPHHQILHAFRLAQNDLRGAAACLWDRLQVLRQHQDSGLRGEDVDAEVAECFLGVINCLSLVKEGQAWLLYRPLPSPGGRHGDVGEGQAEGGREKMKRRILTLQDVRNAWQEELDRVADVAAGRFAVGGEGWGGRGVSGSIGGGMNWMRKGGMPGAFGDGYERGSRQGSEGMDVDGVA